MNSSPLSSVAQSYLTLWDHMDYSTPGFPVLLQLLELAQTHVHQVGDAIQPSHPLSSPSPPAFNVSQHQGLFKWVSFSHQVAKVASASVLPVNIQDWFPLGWTGLISLLSKRLSSVFSKTTFQKHQFFSAQPYLQSNSHINTWPLKNHSSDYTDLCGNVSVFNILSRCDIAFLPRNKHLWISWLQSPSAVILEPKKIKSITVSIVSPSNCMKWWDWMPLSSFFEGCVSSQLSYFKWMEFQLSHHN